MESIQTKLTTQKWQFMKDLLPEKIRGRYKYKYTKHHWVHFCFKNLYLAFKKQKKLKINHAKHTHKTAIKFSPKTFTHFLEFKVKPCNSMDV